MTELPQDRDVYTLADKAIRQTQCKVRYGRSAAQVEIRIKGSTAELLELGGQYRGGQVVPVTTLTTKYPELDSLPTETLETVGQVKDCDVTLEEGGAGGTYSTLVLKIDIPYDGSLDPGENPPQQTKVVTWSERSCQYQFPMERYAGEIDENHEETAYADAGVFESWKNENGSNSLLYKSFQTNIGGSEVALEDRTLALAKKVYAGVQGVERYYPEVTRLSTYRWIKGDDEEVQRGVINEIDETPNLSSIDNTPDNVWSGKFPNTSWLKVGYDVNITPTSLEGYWDAVVTEVWRGIDTTDTGGWDENLYGTNANARWKFYIFDSGNQNNQNNQNNQDNNNQ